MSKKKLLAGLFALNVMALSGLCQNAQAETLATQTLCVKLDAYASAEVDTTASNTGGDITAGTGELSNKLVSAFNIQSNCNNTLYLRATTNIDGTDQNAFYERSGKVYVALGHTTNLPEASALESLQADSTTADLNPNIIGYQVENVLLNDDTDNPASFDTENLCYQIDVEAGETSAKTTIGIAAQDNTFSYHDTAGKYEADVILTTSAT